MTNLLRNLVRNICFTLLVALVPSTHAATRTGITALDAATSFVTRLPATQHSTAIAAHLSSEGHWTLVNGAGEAFTAGSADELKRGWDILLPDLAAAGGKPTIYLTAETVFLHRDRLADLPKAATLWLADASTSFPLLQPSTGGKLLAEFKPFLLIEVGDAAAFRETLTLLARPLDRSGFRLLALEPSGPLKLASNARIDRATNRPLVDAIDPNAVIGAMSSLRGQTALIVGRFDNDALAFKPASAPERTLRWSELAAAATAADVNLLVLKSSAGQQPGGRNWLWQKFEVKGLNDALTRATLADALDALGGPDNRLVVTTTLADADRTILDVHQASGLPSSGWTTARLGGVLTDAMSGLAGQVTHQGALAHFRSAARQAELDRRLIPYVPSWLQWTYGALLLLGLAGWRVADGWWRRIWPAETAAKYSNAFGYWAARTTRAVVFALLFLPLSALAAAPRALADATVRKASPALSKF